MDYNTCCLDNNSVSGIGARIREAREKRNPPFRHQKDLAEAMRVPRERVTLWENGKSKPNADNIAALARVLGVTQEWLSYGDAGDTLSEVKRPSKARPWLDMLDRPEEIRRFDSHIGVGSRIAIITDRAHQEKWNRAELLETLDKIRDWASQAEQTIHDLYKELRRLGGAIDEPRDS